MAKKRVEKIKQKLKELEARRAPGPAPPKQTDPKEAHGPLKSPSLPNTADTLTHQRSQSPSLGLASTHDRFYDQATQKHHQDTQIERNKLRHSVRQANINKITPESLEILEERYNKDITRAILSVDPEMTRSLNFSQVKTVMAKLGLFEDPSLASSGQPENRFDAGSTKKKRLSAGDAELHFLIHLFLFNLGAPALSGVRSHPSDVIRQSLPADKLYLILSLLMCPRLRTAEKTEKLAECFEKSLPEDLADKQRAEMVNFGKTVAAKIMALVGSRVFQKLHQKQIKNIKSEILPMAHKDLAFSPEIGQKSRILAENRAQKIKKSMDTTMRRSDLIPGIKPDPATPSKADLLKFQQELTRQKNESKKYQQDRAAERECTFHPRINQRSMDLASRSARFGNPTEMQSLKAAYERQYGRNDINNARIAIDQVQKQEREREELERECTFRPKITPYDRAASREVESYPKNFEKSVGRARYAWDERVKREQRLNYVNRGEFLEFRRSLPMNPPRCAEDYVVRATEPFMYLNVNVRNGRKGLLGLRTDDIPEAKAEEFAAEFQLEADEQRELEQLIREYISEELAGK